MPYFNRTDTQNLGIDVNKATESKEYIMSIKSIFCHYWYFIYEGFKKKKNALMKYLQC